MLTQLQIRDLAVIEAVTVEFARGFTALTGETGAGKSILIDALALALGERGDSQAIRAGADRLEVSAVFDLPADSAGSRWLADNDFDEADATCLLRRVVGRDGRSKAWINGRPVPVQSLRELGTTLVDICGQQDYQSLRHRAAQRDVLDACANQGGDQGGNQGSKKTSGKDGGHAGLIARVRQAHAAWQAAEQSLAAMTSNARDRDSRVELLSFQLQELQALAPRASEYAELGQEHATLAHRLRIGEAVSYALAATSGDDDASEAGRTAQAAIATARRALDGILSVAPDLGEALQLLTDAEAQLGEAADALRHRLDQLDPDPEREATIADRLAALKDCARKHRCLPDELPALRDRLTTELDDLAAGEHNLERLTSTVLERRATLLGLAAELTAVRKASATALGAAVTANMATLGMPGGRFEVHVSPLPGDAVAATGADEVEFLVTTNAGEPPGPLSRVASGGELSRLSLAIQVVASANSGAPTLVFDEVDAGVGGAVAEMVGRRLRELGRDRQVLCITHLAQVATQAAQQAAVAKATQAGRTVTRVRFLTDEERIEETARMLGGVAITAQTRAHAEEMLAHGRAGKPGRKTPARRRAKA